MLPGNLATLIDKLVMCDPLQPGQLFTRQQGNNMSTFERGEKDLLLEIFRVLPGTEIPV